MKNVLDGIKMQPCCEGLTRSWNETYGRKYPASNHSPMCKNYVTKNFFSVTPLGEVGPYCVLESQDAVDDLCDGHPEEYNVQEIQLTQDQFDRLDEFEGF